MFKSLSYNWGDRRDLLTSFVRSPALSLRKLPSLTQKIILIFCLVLNAIRIQHKSFARFKSLSYNWGDRRDLLTSFVRSPALSLRKLPSLTQKIILIFCLVLNAIRIQHKSFARFKSLSYNWGDRRDLLTSFVRSPALSLRKLPSLTQKIILIFCLVLNAIRIQHKSFARFKSLSYNWGDRRDLNPRQPDPQSGALPLSYDRHILFYFNV